MNWNSVFISLFFLAFVPNLVLAENITCGSIQNAYGPFDFRTDKDKLGVVEAYHFTPEVANLTRGKSGNLGGDIDYTLRAFPNHPRALMAMVQLGEREKVSKVASANYSVECYLQRALQFRNDDGLVKMIYANYLAKKGRSKEALIQLNGAVELGEENASLDYNIGLIYLDLKEYDKALVFAHKAYGAGFPLPGLKDRLKRAGKWHEPSSVPVSIEVLKERGQQSVEDNSPKDGASSAIERR